MRTFPVDLLHPIAASLGGSGGDASLEMTLAPFAVAETTVDTSIRLDGIDLPSLYLDELIEEQFNFPGNPEPGYIDGSIYIDGAHHPVEISKLIFRKQGEAGVSVTMDGVFIFESEGLEDFSNTPFSLTSLVQSDWA